MENKLPGGVKEDPAKKVPSARDIFLLQRRTTKVGFDTPPRNQSVPARTSGPLTHPGTGPPKQPGKDLGKTTGWIHRLSLQKRGVQMVKGVTYERVDDQGLHISVNGKKQVLEVDNVISCAGQEPLRLGNGVMREGS